MLLFRKSILFFSSKVEGKSLGVTDVVFPDSSASQMYCKGMLL